MESERGERATETPPRERTAEVGQVKPFQVKSSPLSALRILPGCIFMGKKNIGKLFTRKLHKY